VDIPHNCWVKLDNESGRTLSLLVPNMTFTYLMAYATLISTCCPVLYEARVVPAVRCRKVDA
jgi:hypothetical protein